MAVQDDYPPLGNTPDNQSSVEGKRPPWEERVPWWRQEEIERGPLAPYDRESTFERSLEAGRGYPEALRPYRNAADSTVATGQGRSETLYDRNGPGLLKPVVAAAFFGRARAQTQEYWANSTNSAQSQEKPNAATARVSAGALKSGPTIVYKGIMLIGAEYTGADNIAFFSMLKKGIDMSSSLPKNLRKFSNLIDTVVYDPPSRFRRAEGAIIDIDAVYAITDLRKKGSVILYKDLRFSAPLEVSMSLLGGGVLAARHMRLIELLERREKIEAGRVTSLESEKRKIDKEIRNRLSTTGKADTKLLDAAECDLQFILHQAGKAHGIGRKETSARLELMRQRRCW